MSLLLLNLGGQRFFGIAAFVVCLASGGCCYFGDDQPVRIPDKPSPKISEPTPISFVDMAVESGLVFTYPLQPRPMRVLEAFGKGCAAFDADNDGWQDVLLVNDPLPLLFRNTGSG
jgi:hypothetical protein